MAGLLPLFSTTLERYIRVSYQYVCLSNLIKAKKYKKSVSKRFQKHSLQSYMHKDTEA